MTTNKPGPFLDKISIEESAQVARVLSYLSVTGTVLLIAIGLKSIFWHHQHHGYILLSFAVFMTVNHIHYRRTGNQQHQKTGVIAIVAALFAYLIASGGESNTGPMWFYIFPPLAFYLTNLRTGLLLTLTSIVFAIIVFVFPEAPFVKAQYSLDFQIRFLATLMFEISFCYAVDFSRRRAHSRLVDMAELYERAASTDELTQLANRRHMQQALVKEFSRYERNGHHFSVVLVDMDHFKKINDEYGHDAGDYVLQAFARLLPDICRRSDLPARWGGEEFLILLPDTSLLQALALAERLRCAVDAQDFVHQGQHIHVTISAGVCSSTHHTSIENLLKQVDISLYEAKSAGRNQIVPRVRRQAEDKIELIDPLACDDGPAISQQPADAHQTTDERPGDGEN